MDTQQTHTKSALCDDDFGIKCFNDEDKRHLIETLEKYYTISIDEEGNNYCGLTMNWNYKEGWVDVSVPDYITKTLSKFQHKQPSHPQYSPHQ